VTPDDTNLQNWLDGAGFDMEFEYKLVRQVAAAP
jgi:hypothetical protein